MSNSKVLILADYFFPGIKAGGPISSLKGLTSSLGSKYEFYILTRGHDLGNKKKYENVKFNNWNQTDYGRVFYLKSNLSFRIFSKILSDVKPDIIYLNSFFSLEFSIKPIHFLFTKPSNLQKVLLCPRGELNEAALNYKLVRKKLYLKYFSAIRLHKKIKWHATNQHETNRINNFFDDPKIILASNISKLSNIDPVNIRKEVRSLNLIYTGRIHPIKNIHYMISVLNHIDDCINVDLTLIGPVEDQKYFAKCLSLTKKLSKNISVNFINELSGEDLSYYYSKSHFFYSLTLGENFGHSIFESFIHSRPVIISNKTPWRDLNSKNIGWDLSLEIVESISETINLAAELEEEDWIEMCKKSKLFATKQVNQFIMENINLFANNFK